MQMVAVDQHVMAPVQKQGPQSRYHTNESSSSSKELSRKPSKGGYYFYTRPFVILIKGIITKFVPSFCEGRSDASRPNAETCVMFSAGRLRSELVAES